MEYPLHFLYRMIFAFLLAVICWTQFPVLLAISEEWSSVSAYSHGWLGAALAFYALWSSRRRLSRMPLEPSWWGGIFAVFCSAGLILASLANVQQVQLLGLFALLFGCVWASFGWQRCKAMGFFWLLLLLSLPVWHFIQPLLRELSTSVSVAVVSLLGVAIERQGYRLIAPGGIFEVEPACSGLGFFLVSALFAVWVAFFNRLKHSQALRLTALCLATALLANWVRIITIILVGNATKMEHIIVKDHLTFGWVVFALFMVPLVLMARRFETTEQRELYFKGNRRWDFKPMLLLLFFIAISYQTGSYLSRPSASEHQLAVHQPAFARLGETFAVSANWWPEFPGASSRQFQFFTDEDGMLQLLVVNYSRQSQGKELIYVDNKLFSPQRWRVVSEKSLKVDNHEINRVPLLHLSRSGARERFIAYWYVIDDRATASSWQAKLVQLAAVLRGKPGASLVAVAVDVEGDKVAGAPERLARFIAALQWRAAD